MRLSVQDDATVRSVRRAFAILRAFGPTDRSLSLGEIALRTRLDKATTRRLLRTLINERLVEQRRPSHEYCLSPNVLALSAGATPADALRRRAQTLLAAVAWATGATAFLLIARDGVALCIETQAGDSAAPPPVAVGKRLPFNISAAPRVLLAFMPPDQRKIMLSRPFPALTPLTPTDPAEIAAYLETIRARGWDASEGHVKEGIWGLGVPIRDASDEVIAALGLAGFDAHLPDDGLPGLQAMVLEKVREWERRFGLPVAVPRALDTALDRWEPDLSSTMREYHDLL